MSIDETKQSGPLAWFAQNHVAANLLMLLIVVGGIISLTTNTVEMFPEMSVDMISIMVPYLGATPAESEEAVCLRVEEAIAGIDGIKRLRSVGMEGAGSVVAELEDFADNRKVLDLFFAGSHEKERPPDLLVSLGLDKIIDAGLGGDMRGWAAYRVNGFARSRGTGTSYGAPAPADSR